MIPPAQSDLAPAGRPRGAAIAIIGALTAATAVYCFHLWPEWRQNPDLSHGFFAPLIFVLLIWESRKQGPWRWLPAKSWTTAALAGVLGAGVLILALAGLFAATLAWSHAVVLFLLAAALACLLGGGLVLLANERLRLVPVNWISLTAVLLWLLVAPIPDGTYSRLTLGLQNWVTANVMNVLHLIGVPARQHGNVIELARTTVGVEEACSGVRSLISCVYAGFFFAAWQVRRPMRRLVLILIAPLLALGMNLLRSLGLTLLANDGVDIAGAWHDTTGFAILGLTAATLAGLAILLESKDGNAPPRAPATVPGVIARGPQFVFWGGTAAALGLGLFFFVHSRDQSDEAGRVPALATLLPAAADGWKVSEPDDLYQFTGILQTTHLMERTYLRADADGQPVQITVYVAYWPAGQTSVSRVASHTPDACWPGAGWTSQTSGGDRRQSLTVGDLSLAPAEYRLFRTDRGFAQHVWFWHVFDGRVIDYRDPYSIPALLQIALQYGFKRQGSQYFVRLSSNRPWRDLASDPLMHDILAGLARTGL
jgi:exosortase